MRLSFAGGGSRERLAAAERGRAALRHRGDALLEVRAGLQALLLRALALGGGADLSRELAAHRLADRIDRERSRRGDLGRERARGLAHLRERREPIDQPDRVRALSVDPLARVEQLERAL